MKWAFPTLPTTFMSCSRSENKLRMEEILVPSQGWQLYPSFRAETIYLKGTALI